MLNCCWFWVGRGFGVEFKSSLHPIKVVTFASSSQRPQVEARRCFVDSALQPLKPRRFRIADPSRVTSTLYEFRRDANAPFRPRSDLVTRASR
jgi:hypothetical protein